MRKIRFAGLATGMLALLPLYWQRAGAATHPDAAKSFIVALKASNSLVPEGKAVTLTARASAGVGSLALVILDATANATVAFCIGGKSCTARVQNGGSASHIFVAEVADSTSASPKVMGRSSTISVRWTAVSWTVTLTADHTTVSAGQSVKLTAAVSDNVGASPVHLVVSEPAKGAVVVDCSSARPCSVQVTAATAVTRTFVGQLANNADGKVVGESSPLKITWR
jgi:hypothetical protein